MSYVKQQTTRFFPGLGDLHAIGQQGLTGYSPIDTTVAINTVRTDAQVIASPPNTGNLGTAGPVVHSLGKAPSWAIAQALSNVGVVSFQFITADNSALYFRGQSHTTNPGNVYARFIAVPD